MKDPYMVTKNAKARLLREWKKNEKIIIAFDFDNTVFDYEGKGYTYPKVIELLKECKKVGAYIYCFTACDESKYDKINKYIKEHNIPCDGINIDYDFIPLKVGRKPYYNILLDDRSGLNEAYKILKHTKEQMIKSRRKINYEYDDNDNKFIRKDGVKHIINKTPVGYHFENKFDSFWRIVFVPETDDFNVFDYDFNHEMNYPVIVFRKQADMLDYIVENLVDKK